MSSWTPCWERSGTEERTSRMPPPFSSGHSVTPLSGARATELVHWQLLPRLGFLPSSLTTAAAAKTCADGPPPGGATTRTLPRSPHLPSHPRPPQWPRLRGRLPQPYCTAGGGRARVPSHIRCDGETNSEVVIPLVPPRPASGEGSAPGVLDLAGAKSQSPTCPSEGFG